MEKCSDSQQPSGDVLEPSSLMELVFFLCMHLSIQDSSQKSHPTTTGHRAWLLSLSTVFHGLWWSVQQELAAC